MNSGTLFTGQGVLAAFTSDLIAANKSRHDILRLAEAFKRKIYGFVIPPDVAYIRDRARKRGETSLSGDSTNRPAILKHFGHKLLEVGTSTRCTCEWCGRTFGSAQAVAGPCQRPSINLKHEHHI